MKHYKVTYKIGKKGEYVYPSGVKGAIWNTVQYHFTDKVMIGSTESEVEADGEEVVELTEEDALSLIEEFKKSFPEVPKEALPFLPERKAELKSVRTRSSKKKKQ